MCIVNVYTFVFEFVRVFVGLCMRIYVCVCVFVLERVRTNVIVFVCTVCVFVCVHSYWHPLVCLFCLRIYVMHTIYFCRISNPVSAFNNALFSSIFHWLVHFRFLRMQALDWMGVRKWTEIRKISNLLAHNWKFLNILMLLIMHCLLPLFIHTHTHTHSHTHIQKKIPNANLEQ